MVTLKSVDKGEEEMVFQYRGYVSWICVRRSSLWSLCFGTIWWMMFCVFLGFAVLLEVSDVISSSRMKFCMMAIYYKFNKLQPAGCNRVSPACSVLLYTICIVIVCMISCFMIIITTKLWQPLFELLSVTALCLGRRASELSFLK